MNENLIDQILNLDSKSIEAVKYIRFHQEVFKTHFPNNPIYPAAMLSNTIEELARYFILANTDYNYTCFPINYKRFIFKDVVRPEALITFTVKPINLLELSFHKKKRIIFSGEGSVDGVEIFLGEIEVQLFEQSIIFERQIVKEQIESFMTGVKICK